MDSIITLPSAVSMKIAAGEVIDRSPAAEGYWAGIPVPTF